MSKKSVKTPLIYALEPRLLFDGDLGADVASSIVYRDGNTGQAPAVAPENQRDSQRENIRFELNTQRTAIVFIDGALEDTQTLVDAVPGDAEVHVLIGDSDGFDQISEILEQHDRVDEIHIFGHGAAGEARLGTASLSLETLTTHSDTLAVLKNSLTEDGDLLLYGCNIAAGEDGEAFIEELAEITAADIAASDDITGISGDWHLETSTGPIEANTIQAWDYQYSLANGIASVNSNTVDKTPSVGSLNVKAAADGGITDSQDRWMVMLEKSNITTADTLYFDENVSVSSYNVSSSTPVASYIVALNDDVARRSQSAGGQVTFEHDILGFYTHKNNTLKSGTMQSTGNNNVTTLSNSYFSNSSWTYPSAGTQTNKRDLEGTFGAYGNGNWVWSADGNDHAAWSSDSRTLYLAAKNGNSTGTGDFIRVITKWSVPGPTAKNDYAWVSEGGSVSAANGQTTTGATGGMTNANSSKTFSDFSGGMERFDFNNDGSKLYVNDYSSGDFKQYSLSTPYDVSTATADNSGDSLDGPTNYYNIIFNGTGSKAFILNYSSDYIREYNLSTAYDIRTASYLRSQYVGSYDTTPTDFEFSSDGSKLFLLGSTNDKIIQLNLSTPYNVTTASNGGTFDIGDFVTNTSLWGMTLSPDGKKLFVADANENVHEFFLPVANDVTTASFLGYTSVSSSIGSIGGIAFNNDGTKFYASDRNSSKIVEYNTSVPFSVQSFMPGGNTGDVLHTTRYASKDTGTNLSVNGFRKGGVEGQGTFSHSNGGSLNGDYGTLTMQLNGSYSYVANNNITGLDAGEVVYDHFNYKAKDGNNNEDTAVLTFTIVGIDNNTLPTAANNTVTIAEDATHTFAASQFNFADSDGDSLSSIKITSLPATGTLTLNGSAVSQNQTITASQIANLVYTPVANGNGDPYTSFQFKVNDGTADSASAYTMTIDVTPANDLPTAANNTVTIAEDTTHTFAASQFNFADIDGDSLSSVKITSLPATGALSLNGSAVSQNQTIAASQISNLVYTPVANGNGDPYTSFQFKVNDGTADSASAYTMTIDVTPANDLPTAANNTVTIAEDTTHTFAASQFNFADIDGDSLSSVKITSLPATGTLTLNGSSVSQNQSIAASDIANLKYTPVANGNGDPYTSFTFKVNDGTADSAAAYTMTIDVTPVNDAPTVQTGVGTSTTNDDTSGVGEVTTNEDTDKVFAHTDFNFYDLDNPSSTLSSVTIAALPTDGKIFVDNTELTSTNLASLGADISKADIDAGKVKFRPDANENGNDYATFTYTVSDGTADSAVATMTVNVTPVNDLPTAADNTVTIAEDTTHSFTAGQFNYADVDSDSLHHIKVTSLPATGTLTLSGTAVLEGQSIAASDIANLVYTPVANGNGDPYTSFQFKVNDGTSDSAAAYTMTIDVTPVNDAPTVQTGVGTSTTNDDTSGVGEVTTNEDTDKVLAHSDFNFYDVDGDTLSSVTIAALPTNGKIFIDNTELTSTNLASLGADISKADIDAGKVKFRPDSGENGDDYATFTYTVSDGTADSAAATMTVNVSPVDDLPTVQTGVDTATTDDDTTGVGTVTTDEDTDKVFVHTDFNFFDPDNPSSDLTSITIAALPSDGKIFIDNVELTSSNLNTLGKDISKADIDSGKVIFRPDANENGSNYAAFTYTVSDGAANSAVATMTVNVTPVNDAPVTTAIDIVKTEDDPSFVTNLLAGQTDADGDTLTLSGSPIISAVDSNGQPLTLPENAVSISGENVTVDPTVFGSLDDGESVTIMVDYGVTDGTASADNSAKITINGVNDAPTISPLTDLKSKDNDPYTFDLLKDAADIDGDTLFVSGTPTFTFTDANGAVTNLPNGAVTMTAVSNSVTDNLLTITPGTFADLASADSVVIGIAYNVSDGTTTTANTAAITIKGSNVPPEVIDTKGTSDKFDDEPHIAEITTDEDTPRVFAASDFNFFDIDGDPLSSVTITSLPTDGQVFFDSDELTAENLATLGANISKADIDSGKLVFRPDPDENGTDYASFSYTVSDGAASSAAATMTVNVTPVNDPPKVATGAETTDTADDTSDIAGVATSEDTDHNFAADDFNFTDVDGDALSSVTITGIPTDGKIFVDGVELTESNLSTLGSGISKSDLDAGKLIFRPDPNENGSGYATFPYTVSDGSASSAVATMTVDVIPVNDAPVVATGVETADTSDDTSGVGEVSTNEDTDKVFAEEDFNFYDLDGDPLSSVTITSLPSDGKIFVDGVELTSSNIGTLGSAITKADIEGGKLLFRPDVGESGPGYADFEYTVSDGTTSSTVAKMTVNVNAAPSATDGLLETDEDIEKVGVLSASDLDNSSLVFSISKLPEHGTVTLIDGGPGYRYTPEKHYYGSDSFQFTASDGSIISDAATVTIDVRPVNDAPIERIKLGTQGVMLEGRVKPINVSTFFGDVDALDPTKRNFSEKVDQLENTVGRISGGSLLSPLDPSGTLQYSVSGLPAGMEFKDGEISGRPTEPGIFTIVMTATDGLGLSAVSSFDLMVGKPVIDRSPEPKIQADKGRDVETPDETTPDLNDHDLPKVLKVKPRRDGDIPIREASPSTVSIGEEMTSGLAADAGLSADSWMNTTTSTSQDVSGNIRVIDLEVKGEEIEVKIADEAVDRAETFKGELADGSRLPNWIKVDPNTGMTTAEPPSGTAPVEMRVIAEDSSGNERAIDLVLNPDALIDNSDQDRGSAREARQAEKQAERLERQEQREIRQAERAERQVQREINQVQRQERQAQREAQQSQRLNAQESSETNQESAKTERREARQAQRLERQESAENSQDNAKTERREARQAQRLERQESAENSQENAKSERREARQAERQARSEAREERRAERAESRAIREVTRLSTEVSVLADGRVKFAEGLTAAGEGSMKLMRMVSAPEAVTIEITDDARAETTRYEVRQQDGTAAPDWVQVNVETGELIIEAPQDSGTLQLTLVAIDGDQQRSIELEVNLDEMREDDDAQTDDVPEASEEIEGEEPTTSTDQELGQYVPLDIQIDAALASNDYGQDLQKAVRARA